MDTKQKHHCTDCGSDKFEVVPFSETPGVTEGLWAVRCANCAGRVIDFTVVGNGHIDGAAYRVTDEMRGYAPATASSAA